MTPFAAVCFCVLMDHHKSGVEEAHPDYIAEKLSVMQNTSDEDCFALLDSRNQDRVRQWAYQWKQPSP